VFVKFGIKKSNDLKIWNRGSNRGKILQVLHVREKERALLGKPEREHFLFNINEEQSKIKKRRDIRIFP
jgi:hypothetical protein